MTRGQKELLSKHAEHYQAMALYVRESNDDELEQLMEACLAASTTNCAWDTYQAAQYLKLETQTEMNVRRRRAASAVGQSSRTEEK